MARGLFTGLVFGSVISVVGLGAVSLLSPLPPSPDVGSDPDSVAAPAERPVVGGDSDGISDPAAGGQAPEVASAGDTDTPTGTAATLPSSAGATDSSPQGTDTTPGARPAVGEATAGLDSPTDAGAAPDVTGVSQRPTAPSQPGGSLNAPDGNDQPISSEPAQPAVPEVSDTASGFGNDPAQDASPEVAVSPDASPETSEPAAAITDPGADEALSTSTEPAAQPDPNGTGPSQPTVSGDSPQPATASPEQPVTAPVVASDAPAQPAPAPTQPATPEPATPEPAEPAAPRVAALPQSGTAEDQADTGPTIGTRVKPLTERGARASSLPNLSDSAGEDAPDEGPAIQRYAMQFENPENKPLMSIVLIDDVGAFGAEALQEFPYPLTFALDPNDPDAIDKLARHRAAGFEVALLADLPEAATAQDAEVSLGAALDALRETVAVVEGVGSGVQGNRPLSDQVTAIAAGTGRGFVTQSNGLNTVQKLAARKGVPSAVVFRDFDGAGQTPNTIRRFLDQAAFRADQEGAVVMLGRVRPDTISALLLWGLQDRASRVALAPLSATLLREPGN